MVLSDTALLLIIGSAGLLIGLLVGAGLVLILADREPDAAKRANLREALRIWRGQKEEDLTLEVDGRVYHRVDDMTVTQYKLLVNLLDRLGEWLNVPELISKTSRAPALHQELDELSPSLPEAAGPPAFSTTKKPAKKISERSPGMEKEIEPINPGLARSFLRALRPKSKAVDEAPASIATQINTILQEKLEGTSLKDLDIVLGELPDGEIRVSVGEHSYDDVAAIPDEAVRALIKACVAEWERSTMEKYK